MINIYWVPLYSWKSSFFNLLVICPENYVVVKKNFEGIFIAEISRDFQNLQAMFPIINNNVMFHYKQRY